MAQQWDLRPKGLSAMVPVSRALKEALDKFIKLQRAPAWWYKLEIKCKSSIQILLVTVSLPNPLEPQDKFQVQTQELKIRGTLWKLNCRASTFTKKWGQVGSLRGDLGSWLGLSQKDAKLKKHSDKRRHKSLKSVSSSLEESDFHGRVCRGLLAYDLQQKDLTESK